MSRLETKKDVALAQPTAPGMTIEIKGTGTTKGVAPKADDKTAVAQAPPVVPPYVPPFTPTTPKTDGGTVGRQPRPNVLGPGITPVSPGSQTTTVHDPH